MLSLQSVYQKLYERKTLIRPSEYFLYSLLFYRAFNCSEPLKVLHGYRQGRFKQNKIIAVFHKRRIGRWLKSLGNQFNPCYYNIEVKLSPPYHDLQWTDFSILMSTFIYKIFLIKTFIFKFLKDQRLQFPPFLFVIFSIFSLFSLHSTFRNSLTRFQFNNTENINKNDSSIFFRWFKARYSFSQKFVQTTYLNMLFSQMWK